MWALMMKSSRIVSRDAYLALLRANNSLLFFIIENDCKNSSNKFALLGILGRPSTSILPYDSDIVPQITKVINMQKIVLKEVKRI